MARPPAAIREEGGAMKLSSVFLATLCAIVLVAVLMLMLGVNVHRVPAQGAKLYNPATETTLKGSVAEIRDFACPVSEGEIGSHLMLKTGDGIVQVHLAPGRIMRSHKLNFNVGDQLTIVGSKVDLLGKEDLIAREITRGNENFVFRDTTGNSMLVQ
jgi:hypothetical protein